MAKAKSPPPKSAKAEADTAGDDSDAKRLSENERKWTKELMTAGWTAIPSVILEHQHAIGLSNRELVLILQIAKHWWKAGSPPRPGKKSIADSMGVDERNVQRAISALRRAKLIEVTERKDQHGQRANSYSFNGLIKAAVPYAVAKQKRLAASAQKEKVARKSKKPKGPQD